MDDWHVGQPVHIHQPTTTQAWVEIVKERLAELGVGDAFLALVDTCEKNEFYKLYTCWPFRWYTVGGGGQVLRSIAHSISGGYNVGELMSWIAHKAVSNSSN
jgi:hypothetical protein